MLRAAKKCDELEPASPRCPAPSTCHDLRQRHLRPPARLRAPLPARRRGPRPRLVLHRDRLHGRRPRLHNPVFVDALPDTYQIDARRRPEGHPKTRGIAATHLYGCPVDIDAVQALASKHNLKVVYDAAQSHLATYKGKGIGAFGDAVTYSFYATKNLATGEGGIVTCNDDALAREIKLLRSHGETDKYLHESVGYNYRMNDITGAIGCSRLDRLPDQTKHRQRQRRQVRRDHLEDRRACTPPAPRPRPTPSSTSTPPRWTPEVPLHARRVLQGPQGRGRAHRVHYPSAALPKQPALSAQCGRREHLAERVLDVLADRATQGTGAELGVVALVDEEVLGGLVELEVSPGP
jgi:dTDP-4-amino-4,6-dideoxygalactose transaminase